jgi:Legume lectin domain/Bacterial lectin/NHL repeat
MDKRVRFAFLSLVLVFPSLLHGQTVSFSGAAVNFGSVNICAPRALTPAPCKETLTLTYKVTAGGVFGTPKVLTLGAPNLDFTLAGTTCAGTVATGLSCTVLTTFAPQFPGLRSGAVQITGQYGNVLATTFLHGVGLAPQIDFDGVPPIQLLSSATAIGSGDGVAIDGFGNVYLPNGGRAGEEVLPGVFELPAGGGPLRPVGAGFLSPTLVAVDGAGNVYVTDTGSNLVVEIPPGCANAGCQINLDGGFDFPYGVAVDGSGNVYVGDVGNKRVVELPAGCSTSACGITLGSGLSFPYAVAVDGAGNLFIEDLSNRRVVKVGAGGGAQSTVVSNLPEVEGIAVDAAGDLFMTDYDNGRILEQPAAGGAMRTLASGLGQPYGLTLDARGNLLFTNFNGSVALSELQRSQVPPHVFATAEVGTVSSDSPQAYTVENGGNQVLSLTGLSVGAGTNFIHVPGPGTPPDCTGSLALAPGAGCDLSISFTPAVDGPLTGAAVLTDNALNATASTQTISLSGSGGPAGSLISFPSGFPSGSPGLALNGGAALSDNALLLTDGGTYESRSAFASARVGLVSFETSFDFQLTGKDTPAPDADGFTFVLQANGPDALGSAGSGLGYGPAGGTATAAITNSVAIKFDLHDGPGEATSSTGLYIDGAAPTTPEFSLMPNGIDLHSGHVFHVTLDYEGGVLNVTITDQTTHAVFGNPFTVDIPGLLGGPTGYAGFTAATGALTAVQRILNWQFTSTACCLDSEPDFPVGFVVPADMSLNGNAEISDRSLELTQDTANETSSAWFPTAVPIDTFTSDFDFKLSPGYGEGFTFVLQSQGLKAIGAGGGGLGYSPAIPGGPGAKIAHSVAVKFDLHSDAGEGSNSTGVYIGGASPTVPYTELTPSINLHSGHTFHVRLTGAVGSLTLRITDLTDYAVFAGTYVVDIPKAVGGANAYVGFTAATGDLFDSVKILNWSMTTY